MDNRYGGMNFQQKAVAETRILRFQNYLLQGLSSSSAKGINASLIINGGGLVAILSYLNNPAAKLNNFLLFGAICFLAAILITVFIVAMDYYSFKQYLTQHNKNVNEFYQNQITLSEMLTEINNNCCIKCMIFISNFFTFILLFLVYGGCISSLLGYLKAVNFI
jgi:hypothetical protein